MSLDDFLREARQKAVKGSLPPTWKPQREGDEVYGVIVDAFPNPWDESTTAYVIRTPGGDEYMTPRNEVLKNLLARFSPEVGDYIYIRYEGLGKRKPGKNPPKIFAVYVKKAGAQVQPPPQPREEELPPVQTLEEVEEEKPEADALKRYVQSLKQFYGNYIERSKFEWLLRQKGFNLTAEQAEKLLPDTIQIKKRGVWIK